MSESLQATDPQAIKQRLERLSLQMELAISHDNDAGFDLAASEMIALLARHGDVIDAMSRTSEH